MVWGVSAGFTFGEGGVGLGFPELPSPSLVFSDRETARLAGGERAHFKGLSPWPRASPTRTARKKAAFAL